MAYTPVDKKDTTSRKKEDSKKDFDEKVNKTGKELNDDEVVVLNKVRLRIRKIAVAALTGVAGVSLVGSVVGIFYMTSYALIHDNLKTASDYLIPTVIGIVVSRFTLPTVLKNYETTKPLYDDIKAVRDSIKGGIGSFKEDVKEKKKSK